MSVEAMSWAFRQECASGPKFVLVALANFAGKDGVTYRGQAAIVSATSLTTRTVSGHMAKLEELGLIARARRFRRNGSRTSDWTVLAPGMERGEMELPDVEEGPATLRELAEGDHRKNLPVAKNDTDHRKISTGPEPLVEPSVDPSDQPLVSEPGRSDLVDVVWQQYRKHKPRMPERVDRERAEVIRRALKVATVEECCQAIDGCFRSTYHQGENELGKRYDSLSGILRGRPGKETTRERIDFFMGYLTARPRSGGAPAQDVTFGLRDTSHWKIGKKTPPRAADA